VIRSASSLRTYGPNVSLLVRPDSAIFVIQTTKGYLITYSLASDPNARVYKPHFPENTTVQARRNSSFTRTRGQGDRILWGPGEGGGIREVSVRFRMVIKVDAGIGKALALDEELVVATQKPAAVQCIRWTPDSTGNQTSTELLSRMGWLPKKAVVLEMTHDRPMNLSTWITSDGKAYAVQRLGDNLDAKLNKDTPNDSTDSKDGDNSSQVEGTKKLFRGYCFHSPEASDQFACKAAINARFSLIAVGCADGSIHVYTARDYVGNIPFSHRQRLSVSRSTSGRLNLLTYSPDGYCLFAGYEHGWATWSVFGKPGSTSFSADRQISESNDESWLTGVKDGTWLSGGSEILLVGRGDTRLWVLEMARSAVTGCFTAANISRTMLLTRSGIMVYRGYDLPDLTTISADATLWHTAQIPPSYLVEQFPMRCAVISSDGRYVAVAGRRGLAHYSINSGRWKTFVDENMENEFQVRGGMCWHQHILVAAVEAGDSYEVRLFSREAALDSSSVLHAERLPAPVVLITLSGDDSLLVYTYDNLLYHYIFATTAGSMQLIQVGQIAFHGIVRSPARVRGLSWTLPDEQVQDGDPSQDVAVATVIFLVDGKLVLLQPSLNEERNLKYDMRVIAQNVEYYTLTRDLISVDSRQTDSTPSPQLEEAPNNSSNHPLRDSLWFFDGNEMKVWSDVQELLRIAPVELGRELPPTVGVAIDFYPLSIILTKGLLLGVEPELVQRRDVSFAHFKFATRVSRLLLNQSIWLIILGTFIHTSTTQISSITVRFIFRFASCPSVSKPGVFCSCSRNLAPQCAGRRS
jgi:RAB6A-GEF complex partner protein 1